MVSYTNPSPIMQNLSQMKFIPYDKACKLFYSVQYVSYCNTDSVNIVL